MLPILPLIIGAAAGAAATQLVRTKAVQQGLKKAGSQIRQAGDTLKQKASDGLDTVRETGAEMRRKVADKLHRPQRRPRGRRPTAPMKTPAPCCCPPRTRRLRHRRRQPQRNGHPQTCRAQRQHLAGGRRQPQEQPPHHRGARGFRGDAGTAPSPPQASSDPQDRAGRGLRHAFDRIRIE